MTLEKSTLQVHRMSSKIIFGASIAPLMNRPGVKPTCDCSTCRKCRKRAVRFRHYHRIVKGETDPAFADRGSGGAPKRLRLTAEEWRERRRLQQIARRAAPETKPEEEPDLDVDLRAPGEPSDEELDRRAAESLREWRV